MPILPFLKQGQPANHLQESVREDEDTMNGTEARDIFKTGERYYYFRFR